MPTLRGLIQVRENPIHPNHRSTLQCSSSPGGKFIRTSEKNRLAAEVLERHVDFEMALSDQRTYPVRQFRAFWEAGRRYAELTKRDPLIHRNVVSAVNGLTDFVTAERRRVPEQIVRDAQRLESLLFDGYDSYFEGHEPPGL